MEVDWWALGILIYEMHAGIDPFSDEDPILIYKKILKSNNEFSVGILWFWACENCIESKTDLLINPFEEILFRRFWNKTINIAQRIFF